ncbi:hypothetical protein K493DRAFT_208503 [Basidiobolus meristosporus CBS 931.73]|uniref:tRNA (guanine(37)-N1)-methyltransferase n=1 Tax=Basidiobolus meristosporus CBS 931.73 TaxID=1314790 RepID=A0A1Y1YW31_9FUNG|nr:hypothetical protein K493DRAFT_208503 [Basidiobolus meristosporus CBS 931.73]|eukprot:ORY02240.1 hypothetical protein K493DRAFT_208503 [Basidiobolus meristosporus CBS 931.73]
MIAPPLQRSMTVLNRDVFQNTLKLIAIRVPTQSIGKYMKLLSKELLNQPRMRNIVEDNDSTTTKLMLLKLDTQTKELENVSEEVKSLIKADGLDLVEHQITVKYDYWNTEEILRAILPEELPVQSSYETIGHIAHMNLREEYLPYKKIIGEVILDKTKHIRTVVNKLDSIDTTFRFFKMEVLAGENDMIAEMRESGCQFKFDFSKVYWNSRLHTEHDRLVQMFKKEENICDVMAGVGPFAVPAAKKGCTVYANDLNPESYKWLCENIKLNKIKTCVPFNMDGRDFIRNSTETLNQSCKDGSSFRFFNHYVMNLPATAIEFLDAFVGLFHGKESLLAERSIQLPMVHCHCFSRSEDPKTDILERIHQIMGYKVDAETSIIHHVRSVAPNKDMYCASFRLTPEIVFANIKRKQVEGEDALTKKAKPEEVENAE